MFQDFDIVAFIEKIPLLQTGASIGLFFLCAITAKILRSLINKQIQKPLNEHSFASKFIHEESKFIKKSISTAIWLIFIATVIYIWLTYVQRFFGVVENFYAPVARSIIVVIIAFFGYKASIILTDFIIERVSPLTERTSSRASQRVITLRHIFKYGASISISIISGLMIIGNFGIDLKAILATVGIASVAIGFGAQSLVKDIISGIFILSEDQYGVGDVVIINGEGGFVERMTLRITQLRNTEGTLITVPNGSITNVKNLTSEWSRVDYKIGVGYSTDMDKAGAVLLEEARKLKADMPGEIIEEPDFLGVDEFANSSVILRIWIKTAPLKQWVIRREYNRRIHMRFEAEGIEIPFPQTTLWVRQPSEEIFAKLAEKVTLPG
jgi:small conductance mechanosensitive channel